jgi:hypothetical protein
VLPNLSLAIDGLTDAAARKQGLLEIRRDEVAAVEEVKPDTALPIISSEPGQLEVYGWESSLWAKLKGYLGV